MTVLQTLGSRLRPAARLALDALLPPQCLSCAEIVSEPGALCAACWAKLRFINAPHCGICGWPFEMDPNGGEAADGAPSGDLVCGACLREPPKFDRARAVLAYDDASRGLILGFKHADRTHAAPAFARWMARAGAELLVTADIIAPVPLHWSRLLARRYNQAALLGNGLATLTGKTSLPDLLIRRRRTPSQGWLSRSERLRNVAGAFAVRPSRLPQVRGRRVLLVDDVLTTGATVGACAAVLRRAGAASIDVLALARVIRPEP
jgi:ComF family protein